MNTIRPVTDKQENCSLVFLVYKDLHMMDQRSYFIKKNCRRCTPYKKPKPLCCC